MMGTEYQEYISMNEVLRFLIKKKMMDNIPNKILSVQLNNFLYKYMPV